ncbi:hypothetical protein [Phaeobacter italicus]|uniref:hypothetical protein n=1 Tax=Phaeobacter italicus TaxID=481446 RepID=UPI00232B5934|nr:hypothetical protein [Phaeobacter italicus]
MRPKSAVPATPSSAAALDGASRRLLHRWDAHLAARTVQVPEREDFEAFGSLSQLERLQQVLNLARPSHARPLRLALKAKRSQRWRKDHPGAETRENRKERKRAELSVPEIQLPRFWRRTLHDMRSLRTTMSEGLISVDDRTPPAAKVIGSIASTLRVLARTCLDHDRPVELTLETVDLWRAARFKAGNANRSIAVRLKELRTFAVWCDLDEDLIDQLTKLKTRYEKSGRKERKRKDLWVNSNVTQVEDVWVRASELLEMAGAAPVGSERRARLVLDATCLALSVVCPLRCGDLHRIRFETHLRRHADYWSLELDMNKTGCEYRRPELWPELTPFLDAVVMLDMPACEFWEAYDRKAGTPLFSRDGGNSGVLVGWPSQCWKRHFGIGEHIIRSLWHTMMFDSEDDDQWIALTLCGQGNSRTAQDYILKGRCKRAGRRARAKLRAQRLNLLARRED